MAHDHDHGGHAHGGHDHDHAHGHDHDHGHGDWFRHDAEAEGLPQAEHAAHVSPAALGIAFVIIVFGVVATVLILSMYWVVYVRGVRTGLQEGTGSAESFLEYRSAATERLQTAAWIDRGAGVVRVPIDRAMDAVVAEYAASGASSVMSGAGQ